MNIYTLTVVWRDGTAEELFVLGDTFESATRIATTALSPSWLSITVEYAT